MGASKSVTIRNRLDFPSAAIFRNWISLAWKKVQEGFLLEMLKYHHMVQGHKKGAREIWWQAT